MNPGIVEIDNEALSDFRRLYKKLYGTNIGYEEGEKMALNVLAFMKFLLEEQNVNEKRIQETTTK